MAEPIPTWATPPPQERPASSTAIPKVAMAAWIVLALIAGVLGVLWLSARSDLDSARADLADAHATIATFQAAEDQRATAQAALPDLEEIIGDVGLDPVTSSATEGSASVHILVSQVARYADNLEDLLDELGFNSAAVIDRISATRALDGTLSADADHVTVTWTYHPDNGLNLVFEVTE